MGYSADSEEWKNIHSEWKSKMIAREKQFKIEQEKFLKQQSSDKNKRKKK